MKKFFLLGVCVAFFSIANAQIEYGIKAGFNISNIGGSDVNNNKARIFPHFGAFLEAGLTDKVSIQPELMYSGQGTRLEIPGDDIKLNLGYLNLPVLLKYNFDAGFYAGVGPQLGFLLSAKQKVGGSKFNVKDDTRNIDFAWVFDLGYQPKGSKIGVDARFNLGLSKLDEDGNAKSYNRVFQVGVFYVLGSTK